MARKLAPRAVRYSIRRARPREIYARGLVRLPAVAPKQNCRMARMLAPRAVRYSSRRARTRELYAPGLVHLPAVSPRPDL